MLTQLCISNFALIESLELELRGGFSVLTGETGAGKSILIDAIAFVLGERAESGLLGPHGPRAEVTAGFDIGHCESARAWLDSHELDTGTECLIRRTLGRDGRSRAYINGQPVPLLSVKELGQLLLDIHGQHEHQSLMRPDTHTVLLDRYAGCETLADSVRERHDQWKRLREELEQLQRAARDAEQRRDYLQFQITELDTLGLQADEIARLDAEHSRLAHGEKLHSGVARALQLLDDDEQAVSAVLRRQVTDIEHLARWDGALTPVTELLNSSLIALDEAIGELRRYGERLEISPEQLAALDQRLAAIQHLARKHRTAPEQLPNLLQQLRDELTGVASADQRMEALPALIDACLAEYAARADELSRLRTQAATRLAAEIEHIIRGLGMPKAEFRVELLPAEGRAPSPWGWERAELRVSANPGYAPATLAKVASGGELSRISLAIQVATAAAGGVPTLIFDEVDTGIGGGVAETVGKQLRQLGTTRQVLCVTHLPQVAALAQQHLRVSKLSGDNTTRVRVEALAEKDRGEELARMLGGNEITRQTRAHAREMLRRGQQL